MDLMQILMNQLSGDGLKQISQQIGTDEKTTGQAVSTAVPVLISALAKNASQPDGADALHKALQDHDGGILDDVAGYLAGDTEAAKGGAILGHVLGDRQNMVEAAISKQTGLDMTATGKILAMIAPLVMSALGKAQRQSSFDPRNLSGYLNGQQQQAQEAAPDMLRVLTNLLDSNKDGSVLDDLVGMAGKVFGKK